MINKEKIYPILRRRGKLSAKKGPVISLISDLEIIFENHISDTKAELIHHNMPEAGYDIYELYSLACSNIVRDVEFVIANTMYGGYAIIADGKHEASALMFKSIWTTCVEKLCDDLIIMVPAADTVLFAPKGNKDAVEKLIEHGEIKYDGSSDKISKELFVFSEEEKELKRYEKED